MLIASDAFTRYQTATGGVNDRATGLLKLTSAQFGKLQSLNFLINGVRQVFCLLHMLTNITFPSFRKHLSSPPMLRRGLVTSTPSSADRLAQSTSLSTALAHPPAKVSTLSMVLRGWSVSMLSSTLPGAGLDLQLPVSLHLPATKCRSTISNLQWHLSGWKRGMQGTEYPCYCTGHHICIRTFWQLDTGFTSMHYNLNISGSTQNSGQMSSMRMLFGRKSNRKQINYKAPASSYRHYSTSRNFHSVSMVIRRLLFNCP